MESSSEQNVSAEDKQDEPNNDLSLQSNFMNNCLVTIGSQIQHLSSMLKILTNSTVGRNACKGCRKEIPTKELVVQLNFMMNCLETVESQIQHLNTMIKSQ